jgi:hypothetical protein
MDKNIWKYMMVGTISIMALGFVLAVWSFNEHHEWGMYTGLVLIAGVCVSWWFWVMFIIRTMIEQTDRTCRNLTEVKHGLVEVKGLVKEYAEFTNASNRQRRKSPRARLSDDIQ